MSSDDEEEDTVEPSVPLLSKPGFVAETPCYGFENDKEEENDEEVDEEEKNDEEENDDNAPKQKTSVRENKRKRLTVSNKSSKSKKNIVI